MISDLYPWMEASMRRIIRHCIRLRPGPSHSLHSSASDPPADRTFPAAKAIYLFIYLFIHIVDGATHLQTKSCV